MKRRTIEDLLVVEHTRGKGKTIGCSEDVVRLLKDTYCATKEILIVFYLDRQNKVIAREVVGVGTLTQCPVHPREIYRGAILRNADSIIMAHNHPSYSGSPSMDDDNITSKVSEAGKIVGIQLIDHIIVCGDGGEYYSYADNRRLL